MIKVDRTTASRAIQKLEQNGLIEKRADSVNKKIKRLFTTTKGDELAEYIVKENNYSNKVALKGLLDEEVKTFSRILNKIKQNTETEWDFVKKGNKRDY